MIVKILNYVIGFTRINPKYDVLLVSFPKSGNTWLRFFYIHLANLIYSGRLEDCDSISFSCLDSNMPELGYSSLNYSEWMFPEVPRLIKTHSNFYSFLSKSPIVYIVRDPFDVMISYYRYELGKTKPRFKGSFSQFIRHSKFGVESWAKHYVSWIPYIDFLIRYEDLKDDPISQFNRFLEFLKINVSNEILIQTHKNSEASKVKKIESQLGMTDKKKFSQEFSFVSSNDKFSFQNLFNDSDREYVNNILSIYNLPYER